MICFVNWTLLQNKDQMTFWVKWVFGIIVRNTLSALIWWKNQVHTLRTFLRYDNSPVSHLARHQRPAREGHKFRIASRENVDNQMPRNTNFTH